MRMLLALVALLTLPVAAPAQETASAPKAAPAATAADKFNAELIPRNSKAHIGRFAAEGEQDLDDADFEISGTADKKGAGLAKKLLLGDFRSTTSASIQVVNTETGAVTYADSSHRSSANRGMRSSAEKIAKYLKKKIEDDEKKAA